MKDFKKEVSKSSLAQEVKDDLISRAQAIIAKEQLKPLHLTV